jgi:3-hydroxy-9,10-secoandrosta-1,3,5(10)-triene-9,17-dione monooxygenase reductase component
MSGDQLKESIGKVLGRIPSGVFILTAMDHDKPAAMLASWVQQAGFEPPTITVALATGRPIADIIRTTRKFALSIVPQEDTALMRHYARAAPADADPFANVRTEKAPSGMAILADALGYLDCRLLDVCDFGGDHELFIGEVRAANILREGRAFTHQRGNGLHY